ncbi:FK506-binding protein 2B [Absidia repens]|uniref:peptidylprolyl isomerase n=1 Tax=Absidia repens TaxID=90262 RepID=A0A1X2J0P6_9FUNG|nr:FK506-binding protein 2B [Absidia repens]
MRVLPLLLAGFAVLVSGDVAKAPVTELQIDVEHEVPEELCTQKSRDGDKLYMHYTGTLYDTGAKFDSSVDRNQPFDFVLGSRRVIPGWELGLKNMCIGEKRRLTIPSKMAYGDRGVGRIIPGGATLVFDVELLDIKSNRQIVDQYEQFQPSSFIVYGGIVIALIAVLYLCVRKVDTPAKKPVVEVSKSTTD